MKSWRKLRKESRHDYPEGLLKVDTFILCLIVILNNL